jgi:hypothetical protein
MKIRAYIRVVGDEIAIRAIHNEANLQEAVVSETKAPKDNGAGAKWWNWKTPQVPLDADNPNAGLKQMLSKYRPFFPFIRKQKGPDCVAYLQLVTEYNENEGPRGLYLSDEVIGLLNELGAALDNDVVLRE